MDFDGRALGQVWRQLVQVPADDFLAARILVACDFILAAMLELVMEAGAFGRHWAVSKLELVYISLAV